MSIKELKDLISGQAFNLNKARTRGFMVNQETEKMRNLLVNNLDEILAALDTAIDAEERIARLVVEVESADAELAEKDDEIKALKGAADKPVGKRRKLSVIEDDVK